MAITQHLTRNKWVHKATSALHSLASVAEEKLREMKDRHIEEQGPSKKKSSKHHKSAKKQDQFSSSSLRNPTDVIPDRDADPAHAPGHRKMDLKSEFDEATGDKHHVQHSALNQDSTAHRVYKNTSPHRRIQSPNNRASKAGRSVPKSSH